MKIWTPPHHHTTTTIKTASQVHPNAQHYFQTSTKKRKGEEGWRGEWRGNKTSLTNPIYSYHHQHHVFFIWIQPMNSKQEHNFFSLCYRLILITIFLFPTLYRPHNVTSLSFPAIVTALIRSTIITQHSWDEQAGERVTHTLPLRQHHHYWHGTFLRLLPTRLLVHWRYYIVYLSAYGTIVWRIVISGLQGYAGSLRVWCGYSCWREGTRWERDLKWFLKAHSLPVLIPVSHLSLPSLSLSLSLSHLCIASHHTLIFS